MRKRGSAIIIAMLMIASIGVIAFGIAGLLFSETTTAALYENGSVAYFAAESGIEEGFLRYRYDQNAKVPTNWSFSDKGKVYRSTLSGSNTTEIGDSNTGIDTLVLVNDPTLQVYDLRMGYLGTEGQPFYGQDTSSPKGSLDVADLQNANYGTGDYSYLHVPQDESIKINLTGLKLSDVSRQLKLFYKMSNKTNNIITGNCTDLMEAKITYQDESNIIQEYKDLLASSSFDTTCGIDVNKILKSTTVEEVPSSDNSWRTISISNVMDILTRAGRTPPQSDWNIQLTLRPLYHDAYFGLTGSWLGSSVPTDNADIIPGPITKVESTGYFGGVAKKLTANIDRQSGSLYDLYDYVLFKQN